MNEIIELVRYTIDDETYYVLIDIDVDFDDCEISVKFIVDAEWADGDAGTFGTMPSETEVREIHESYLFVIGQSDADEIVDPTLEEAEDGNPITI